MKAKTAKISRQKEQRLSWALVTGAGRGLGRAVALRLVADGYSVLGISRSADELKETGDLASKICPGRFFGKRFDLSKPRAAEKVAQWVDVITGHLEILVNNAAMLGKCSLRDLDEDALTEVLHVNTVVPLMLTRALLPELEAAQGSVINIVSIGALQKVSKFPGMTAYIASKAALIGATELLAVELKDRNIRVNCVAPGALNTRMLKEAAPHLRSSVSLEDAARVVAQLGNRSLGGLVSGVTVEINSNIE